MEQFQCTACLSFDLKKWGKTTSGKQRYMCKNCSATIVPVVPAGSTADYTFLAIWIRRLESRINELETELQTIKQKTA